MAQPVKSRTQQRIERKQVVLIGVLILAVAGVSFFLGAVYGRESASKSGLAMDIAESSLPSVTQEVPPPPPEAAPAKPEKLTFYENLPKGSQVPLGSGINLPTKENKANSTPKKINKPAPLKSKQAVAPTSSVAGSFIVQVASFRTGKDAKKMATRLEQYNLTAFVESADLGEKGVWHRVLAGPYADRASADQAAALLREKERLSALVRQR